MMPFHLFILLALFLLSSCAESSTPSNQPLSAGDALPSLIPLPQSIAWGEEAYLLPSTNTICYNEGAEKPGKFLAAILQELSPELSLTEGTACGNLNVIIDPSLRQQLGSEGYKLEINRQGIAMQGATEAGLFYAIQTLRQMLPPGIEKGRVPDEQMRLAHVRIEDMPKYSWRGNMIDIARSFFGLDYLKQHVDRMALYKLNRLHLHLTDDQGWRIEIKSKPALTETGAQGAVEDGRSGYLTQQEYLELQEYALARHIIIIPEIDMPGHTYAALASYPELNCAANTNIEPRLATPPQLYSGQQVGWSKFCLTKPDEVYSFVATVIGELAAMTSGPWIHIGGDEIEDPLYQNFIEKADSIVRRQGKITIGWEEVTKARVDSTLISQVWHGKTESVVNVRKIQSVCSHFYFDHANVPGQEETNNWCKETGVSLEDVYSFRSDDPDVIGVESALWTELVHSEAAADNRLWPRTIAFAEVAWTSESALDFTDFTGRLSDHSARLDYMGIHSFQTPGIDWGNEDTAGTASSALDGFMPE